MERHLSLPKKINHENLDEWSQHLINQGIPISVICEYLSQQSEGRGSRISRKACITAAQHPG